MKKEGRFLKKEGRFLKKDGFIEGQILKVLINLDRRKREFILLKNQK